MMRRTIKAFIKDASTGEKFQFSLRGVRFALKKPAGIFFQGRGPARKRGEACDFSNPVPSGAGERLGAGRDGGPGALQPVSHL